MQYFNKSDAKIKQIQDFTVKHGSLGSRISYSLIIGGKALRWKLQNILTHQRLFAIAPNSEMKYF
jgi:hypothetical protein